MKNETINHQKASESPCNTCSEAPCCHLLQLQQLSVNKLTDLDLIAYYLNFENITAALTKDGNWTIYYRYPCTYLNQEDYSCTIHNTPQQPNICIHYNPYNCFYKTAHLAKTQTGGAVIWMNRARMQHLMDLMLYDESRQLVQLPEDVDVFAELEAIPYQDPELVEVSEDPVRTAWKKQIQAGEVPVPQPVNRTFEEIQNPCKGCAAHCCTNLLFVQGLPVNFSNLDYYKYCLGFPGVELGISDTQWTLIVKTKCRHLDADNQCGIYGQPERPLVCKYYDAGSCTYKVGFGQERPQGYMRVGYEEYNWLLETYRFDDAGNITVGWNTETLRQHIEELWRTTPAKEIQVD